MMNSFTPLTTISPIDGRYHNKTKGLSEFFSEFALIKYRVLVEIKYLIELNNILNLNIPNISGLQNIIVDFSQSDALLIKEFEKTTNHDVKAVEYFVKKKMDELNLSEFKEFVHFGLTSQDINNTAIPLQLLNWIDVYLKEINDLLQKIKSLSQSCIDTPMLARTHGQPASPTRMDKELLVFVERLENQIFSLYKTELSCKFGGATGNFNAHHVAYPNIDWKEFANKFTQKLGLKRSQYTTQIDHYDSLAVLFDNLRRINIILIDFCRDIWQYISMNYFNQKTNPNEVGSSAMPHKVNPIDFENAEGNLGIANALLTHLSEKLPISRLQRDLTDSTVLRNIGVPIAHIKISIDSIQKGIDKLVLNEKVISADLENNWSVVTEGIQTVLRREKVEDPYEKLKDLSRGKEITQETIDEFINQLEIPEIVKDELRKMSPKNYTGI